MDLPGWSLARMPDVADRTVLVTGANSGIGFEAAAGMASRGATVLLACRNLTRATDAVRRCQERATGPSPRAIELDLSDLGSVRACAAAIAAEVEQLDVLINNAGVMALPRLLTVDGLEMQFATNHLGHFALTGLLLPLLRRGRADRASRVVTASSLLAARATTLPWDDLQGEVSYDPWAAYHRSKLANLLFAYELDRRATRQGWGLRSVAAHPGLSSTRLVANGRATSSPSLAGAAVQVGTRLTGQSPRKGAFPLLRAATDPDRELAAYYGPRGPGHLRGRPVPASPPAAALDAELASRLWDVSERLSGVAFPAATESSPDPDDA